MFQSPYKSNDCSYIPVQGLNAFEEFYVSDIYPNKNISDKVTIRDNFEVSGDIIQNGQPIPFQEIVDDTKDVVLVSDVNQVIDGVKTFLKPPLFQQGLQSDGNIVLNGNIVNSTGEPLFATPEQLQQFDAGVVHIEGDETIQGRKVFTDSVDIHEHLTIDVPDVSIPKSVNQYMKDFSTEITQLQTSYPLLNATVTQQKTIVDTNMVTLNSPQTVTGPKTFSGQVQFNNNVTVTGSVHTDSFVYKGSELQPILDSFVRKDGSETITGQKTFTVTPVVNGRPVLVDGVNVSFPSVNTTQLSIDGNIVDDSILVPNPSRYYRLQYSCSSVTPTSPNFGIPPSSGTGGFNDIPDYTSGSTLNGARHLTLGNNYTSGTLQIREYFGHVRQREGVHTVELFNCLFAQEQEYLDALVKGSSPEFRSKDNYLYQLVIPRRSVYVIDYTYSTWDVDSVNVRLMKLPSSYDGFVLELRNCFNCPMVIYPSRQSKVSNDVDYTGVNTFLRRYQGDLITDSADELSGTGSMTLTSCKYCKLMYSASKNLWIELQRGPS